MKRNLRTRRTISRTRLAHALRYAPDCPPPRVPCTWAALALALVHLCCAASASAPATAPPAAPTAQLSIHTETREGRTMLRVELLLPPPDDAPRAHEVRLHLPTEHGGRQDLLQAIRELEAQTHPGASALPLVITGEGEVIAALPEHTGLRIRYLVDPAHDALTRAERYRPLRLGPALFVPLHAVLVQPEPGIALPWRLRLGPDVRSAGPTRSAARPFTEIVNSGILAGPWHEELRNARGIPVSVLSPAPPHPELIEFMGRIADLQQRLVPGALHAVLLPRADHGINGFALHDAIVLELPRLDSPPGLELRLLIAHENLHRLIGHRITFADADAFRTLWFREGITDYLAWRTLIENGLAPLPALQARLDAALDTIGPAAPPPEEWPLRLDATFWRSPALQHLPYAHGLLLGLLIDARLRAEDTGLSLEDFVRWLSECPGAPHDGTTLLRALETYSGQAWQTFWTERVGRLTRLHDDPGWRLAGLAPRPSEGGIRVADPAAWHQFLEPAPAWQRATPSGCGRESARSPRAAPSRTSDDPIRTSIRAPNEQG